MHAHPFRADKGGGKLERKVSTMGNSLIFIEVFIVYRTARQTGVISIFLLLLSFVERRFDKGKENKKNKL